MKRLLLLVIAILLIMTACTSAGDSPTVDFGNVQSLQPTISPAEIEAFAQLADEEILAEGQQIYETSCAACHGINGEGQFPSAPMQPDSTGRIGAPPHNGEGHTWHHDDDLLIQIMREGGMGNPESFYPMPAFGEQLSESQIEAVIAYIKTMWTDEQRTIQAERTLLIRQQN